MSARSAYSPRSVMDCKCSFVTNWNAYMPVANTEISLSIGLSETDQFLSYHQ